MVNDLNTLTGALVEMKDQLIYELGEKGVTASYDSTTGLLGLIGKISEIQQGGGSCYHIEFSEDSYVAVGGSVTLECFLQENYQPKSGATITVTGSDSSLYTGLTDNSGVATVTVTVNSDTTFTASYSNVSDICTVTTGPTYLFYDDCTTDKASQYGSYIVVRSPSSGSLAFSTDHYILSGSGSNSGGYAIPNVASDNVKFRVKFKLTQSNAYNQFMMGVCNGTSYNNTKGIRIRGDKLFQKYNLTNGSESETTIYTHSTNYTDAYYYAEIIKEGTTLTMKLYNSSLTQLASGTQTVTGISTPTYLFYGLTNRGTSYQTLIQEVLVESVL